MDCTHTGNSIGNPKIYTDAEGLKELEGNASTNPNGLNTLPIDIKLDQELTYILEVFNGIGQAKPITRQARLLKYLSPSAKKVYQTRLWRVFFRSFFIV
jgi:hypothetical protein